MSSLSYVEATVVGLFQGVTELFPVSSLGHSVLVPALIGGRWAQDLNVSSPESPYLAFIVGLHVATAAALLLFFWRDWVQIIAGFFTSIRYRRIQTTGERLAWLIVVGTIVVGVCGVALEHTFRTTLGKPIPAAAFLIANGVILYAVEHLRRRLGTGAAGHAANANPMLSRNHTRLAEGPAARDGLTAATTAVDESSGIDDRLAKTPLWRGALIGSAQTLALLPGISRSGVTMTAGLLRGLTHEEAARISFLLATPVILAAGVLKIPDLFGPLGAGIGGQVFAGSVASFVSAYLAVRFLTKYFHTRTLKPFAVYCVVAGVGSLLWLTLR
ncbi:MAG: putative bacitracin resistance protein [Mycobacterium sp.]|nr:putative bacitracin resistance protein [Mycobacterium sp.]